MSGILIQSSLVMENTQHLVVNVFCIFIRLYKQNIPSGGEPNQCTTAGLLVILHNASNMLTLQKYEFWLSSVVGDFSVSSNKNYIFNISSHLSVLLTS
jgi:hypothetical protein